MNCFFNFVAFMTPPPKDARGDQNVNKGGNDNFQTEEHYNNIKKCGFNSLCACYEYTEEEYLTALSLAEKFGMTFMVRDQLYFDRVLLNKNISDERLMQELESNGFDAINRFTKYSKYKSFSGFLVADEPSSKQFYRLKTIKNWISSKFPNINYEVNLLPIYASNEQLFGDSNVDYEYQKYLDLYIDIYQPNSLSYDFYALMKNAETGEEYIRDGYLKNLEILAKTSIKHNLPFEVFLLNLGHWDFRTVTTHQEIGWQVYSAMAYGAAGAQTFTYWTMLNALPGNDAHVTTAIVGMKGELLPQWYSMQKVIQEIRFFENYYCKCKWNKTIFICGKDSKRTNIFEGLEKNSDCFVDKIESSQDIIVGCFECANTKAYLISNVTDPKYNLSTKVKIKLPNKSLVFMNCKKTELDGEQLLQIGSGSGAFLLLG